MPSIDGWCETEKKNIQELSTPIEGFFLFDQYLLGITSNLNLTESDSMKKSVIETEPNNKLYM